MQALKPLVKAVLTIRDQVGGPRTAEPSDLARIRMAMIGHVIDCELKTVRRVRAQIDAATSAMQLWLLRSEIYQAVAEEFGQPEAQKRVAKLSPLFDGLLPRKHLRAV